jgi:hypothetical protein
MYIPGAVILEAIPEFCVPHLVREIMEDYSFQIRWSCGLNPENQKIKQTQKKITTCQSKITIENGSWKNHIYSEMSNRIPVWEIQAMKTHKYIQGSSDKGRLLRTKRSPHQLL